MVDEIHGAVIHDDSTDRTQPAQIEQGILGREDMFDSSTVDDQVELRLQAFVNGLIQIVDNIRALKPTYIQRMDVCGMEPQELKKCPRVQIVFVFGHLFSRGPLEPGGQFDGTGLCVGKIVTLKE